MELFLWMWAFDKRLFCSYTGQTFVYIWLAPGLLSFSILALTYMLKLTSDETEVHECMTKDSNIKRSAIQLQKLMLIQEGILVSIFFVSVVTFILTDRMYKNSIEEEVTISTTKKDNTTKAVEFTTKNCAYDFPLR